MKTSFLQSEIARYSRKGVGLIPAFIMVCLYFYSVPRIGQIIWPYALQISECKVKMYLILQCGLNVTMILLINMIMGFVYYIQSPFFEQFKILKQDWPWKTDKREEWFKFVRKSILFVSLNSLIVLPLVLYTFLWINNWKISEATEISKLPDTFTFFWQFMFQMVMEDLAFHFAHKALHTRWLYNNFHKIHHQYTMTISLAGDYAHPIEFIFSNVIPTGMGALILGNNIHMYTFCAWVAWRQFESADGHSGYDFPWSPYRLLPCATGAEYHDFHHSKNVGNYSSTLSIWDNICGTNKVYYEHLDKRYEKVKHR